MKMNLPVIPTGVVIGVVALLPTALGNPGNMGFCIAHNLGLASSGNGPTANGRIAVAIGLVVVAAIAYLNLQKEAKR